MSIEGVIMKQLDVIGLGATLIEQTARIRQLPKPQRAVACASQQYGLVEGGGIGTLLTILSRFGLKVGYVGKVAGDDFGVRLTKSLMNARIDLSRCQILPLAQSPWSWTLHDDSGQTLRVIFPNILSQIDEAYLIACSQYLNACRLFVVEICGIPLTSCIMATEFVKANGIPVIMKLSLPVRDIVETLQAGSIRELEELLAFADVLMMTFESAAELSDQIEPEKMAAAIREKYLVPVIGIFDETQGSFFESEEERFSLPPFPMAAAAPCANADGFYAGITYGMRRGWPLRETARFAQACGVLHGSPDGLVSEANVMRFLAEQEHPETVAAT